MAKTETSSEETGGCFTPQNNHHYGHTHGYSCVALRSRYYEDSITDSIPYLTYQDRVSHTYVCFKNYTYYNSYCSVLNWPANSGSYPI